MDKNLHTLRVFVHARGFDCTNAPILSKAQGKTGAEPRFAQKKNERGGGVWRAAGAGAGARLRCGLARCGRARAQVGVVRARRRQLAG